MDAQTAKPSGSEVSSLIEKLYLPLLGRLYTTIRFPHILYDATVLEIRDSIPDELPAARGHTQLTFLQDAVRSANIDRYILDFLSRKPSGIIVELGCGLETTYYRLTKNRSHTATDSAFGNTLTDKSQNAGSRSSEKQDSSVCFYAIDLPDVISYRCSILSPGKHQTVMPGNAFSPDWIRAIRKDHSEEPLLITAGDFFTYFKENQVIRLLHELGNFGEIEIVFDALNSFGMKQLIPKQLRKGRAKNGALFFYVDSSKYLVEAIGGHATILDEKPFYRHIDKNGLESMTKISMATSDIIGTLKMIHLAL